MHRFQQFVHHQHITHFGNLITKQHMLIKACVITNNIKHNRFSKQRFLFEQDGHGNYANSCRMHITIFCAKLGNFYDQYRVWIIVAVFFP